MSVTVVEPSELVPTSPEGRGVLAKFFRALGDPGRLALLAFIAEAERTGTECVEHLGLSQSRVSAHLACLVTCGFVEARREGRFVYYSVTDHRVLDLVRLGADVAADNAAAVAACARVGGPA
jgi:DNA-binding transcriptional ArsR family regulator